METGKTVRQLPAGTMSTFQQVACLKLPPTLHKKRNFHGSSNKITKISHEDRRERAVGGIFPVIGSNTFTHGQNPRK